MTGDPVCDRRPRRAPITEAPPEVPITSPPPRTADMHPPTRPTQPLRILVSAARLGVAGGNQRAVFSWLRALQGHELVVAARHFHDGPYARLPRTSRRLDGWRVVPPRASRPQSYWRLIARQLRPRGSFDLYMHFWGGRDLSPIIRADHRLLIPSGAQLNGLEDEFELVLSQSHGGVSLLTDRSKHEVVPPPTFPLAEDAEPVDGLPDEYLLTVFNPYGNVKGVDVFERIAGEARRPIVWCRSSHTEGRLDYTTPRNVVEVVDPSPGQLLYLYDNCEAYVSFSHSEGYGWAIADALLTRKPVISRRIGVLTLFAPNSPGVYLYEQEDVLRELVRRDGYHTPAIDLAPIHPSSARRWIESFCAG